MLFIIVSNINRFLFRLLLYREAVSTVRKKPTLSIKLTDNSATKRGISLTHPCAARRRQSVCERERKTHAALSCLLNHHHQRMIQIHQKTEFRIKEIHTRFTFYIINS